RSRFHRLFQHSLRRPNDSSSHLPPSAAVEGLIGVGKAFASPPSGRVGDWRAGLGRSLCSLLARSFVCECHTISAVPRFQPPPRRTQHADFPHCALLFASPQGLWGRSCRSGFRRWSNHSVAIEQLQSLVQPSPYSTAPSRSPVGSGLAAYGAGSSSPPSLSRSRSTRWRVPPQSSSPNRAAPG